MIYTGFARGSNGFENVACHEASGFFVCLRSELYVKDVPLGEGRMMIRMHVAAMVVLGFVLNCATAKAEEKPPAPQTDEAANQIFDADFKAAIAALPDKNWRVSKYTVRGE